MIDKSYLNGQSVVSDDPLNRFSKATLGFFNFDEEIFKDTNNFTLQNSIL